VMFGCSDVYHWMGFGTYLQHGQSPPVSTSRTAFRRLDDRLGADCRQAHLIGMDARGKVIMRQQLSRGRLERHMAKSWPRSNHQKLGRGVAAMIFVLSSFIRLSEPISRGTVTEQRNSTTRLRVSCPTSRTSEHSSARGCDVRMFGCLPLDRLRHLPSARSIASGLDISHRGSRYSHASRLKGNAQHSLLTAATKSHYVGFNN
jgi:hypothetical protein